MAEQNKTKRQPVSTIFDIKEVVVIVTASITIAGAFFAYNTKLAVVENKVHRIEQEHVIILKEINMLNQNAIKHETKIQQIKENISKLEKQ